MKTSIKTAIYALVARCVPDRFWGHLALTLGTLGALLRPRKARSTANHLARIVGDTRPPDLLAHAERDRAAERMLSALLVHKLHDQPTFQPAVALRGKAHIDAALAQGRGAVLWSAQFHAAHVVEPLALHRAGIALHHLSRRDLGMNRAAANRRWVDMAVAVEDRFLAERIVMDDDGAAAVLTLRQRLKDNGVVVVRALNLARRVFELPFFDGRLRLAPGALELAWATGAAVLPVFTIRSGASAFRVHVEAPLEFGAKNDRKAAIEAAMIDYAARLEAQVLAHPAQWNGWTNQASPAEPGDDAEVRVVPGRTPP